MEALADYEKSVINLIMSARDIANRTGSKVVIDDSDKFDQRVIEIAKMLQIERNTDYERV